MKKTWNWLKGKKRNIGITAMFLLQGIRIFEPELIDESAYNWMVGGISFYLMGGTVDAVSRSDYGKQKIANVKKIIKLKK